MSLLRSFFVAIFSGCSTKNILARDDDSSSTWPYHCPAGMNVSELQYNLTGKTFLITGSNGRLGYQVALAAARSGARVIASTRTEEEAASTKERFETDLGDAGGVQMLSMDLSSFASVRGAAEDVLGKYSFLDGMVHVAGTGMRDNVTKDGLVATLQINLFSPALLTDLLMPALLAAPAPRVVYIGSANSYDDMHWNKTDPVGWLMRLARGQEPFHDAYSSYGLSKLLDVHYAAEQALRLPNLTTFSVQPGFFRDPPSAYSCPPDTLFRPCPQSPVQAATSTFFALAQPRIGGSSGVMFDFETNAPASDVYNWTQSGETCIPRKLPRWNGGWNGEVTRSQWYDQVQDLIKATRPPLDSAQLQPVV